MPEVSVPIPLAYVAKVEGQQILILLAQMPELDDRFISAVDLLHRATEAANGHVWITVHLSDPLAALGEIRFDVDPVSSRNSLTGVAPTKVGTSKLCPKR